MEWYKLPIGVQPTLGPVPNAPGLESFTNNVLVTLLRMSYNREAWGIYNELFEILRLRGVFQNESEALTEVF